MTDKFYKDLLSAHQKCTDCPKPAEVIAFYKDLIGVLFMDYSNESFYSVQQIKAFFDKLEKRFIDLLGRNEQMTEAKLRKLTTDFFNSLPKVYELLNKDLKAIYEGDPAAKNEREIIRSYPGFYAIMVYRIANAMHVLGIDDFPRILTEYAHSRTGIDIHPGATIGAHFCIDHGTGIVIGETSNIGEHVKIYQGVTLGALSVEKSDANTKRHPTIEDNVIIYANAAILGGKTVIGKGSIIGGNVWLTRSVEPGTKLYYKAHLQNGKENTTDTVIIREVHN